MKFGSLRVVTILTGYIKASIYLHEVSIIFAGGFVQNKPHIVRKLDSKRRLVGLILFFNFGFNK